MAEEEVVEQAEGKNFAHARAGHEPGGRNLEDARASWQPPRKRITVEQLHEATPEYVKLASRTPVEVTVGGKPAITLQPAINRDAPGTFSDREEWIRTLPLITVDSAEVVSADRDGR